MFMGCLQKAPIFHWDSSFPLLVVAAAASVGAAAAASGVSVTSTGRRKPAVASGD